jgi:hypothetical protein
VFQVNTRCLGFICIYFKVIPALINSYLYWMWKNKRSSKVLRFIQLKLNWISTDFWILAESVVNLMILSKFLIFLNQSPSVVKSNFLLMRFLLKEITHVKNIASLLEGNECLINAVFYNLMTNTLFSTMTSPQPWTHTSNCISWTLHESLRRSLKLIIQASFLSCLLIHSHSKLMMTFGWLEMTFSFFLHEFSSSLLPFFPFFLIALVYLVLIRSVLLFVIQNTDLNRVCFWVLNPQLVIWVQTLLVLTVHFNLFPSQYVHYQCCLIKNQVWFARPPCLLSLYPSWEYTVRNSSSQSCCSHFF